LHRNDVETVARKLDFCTLEDEEEEEEEEEDKEQKNEQ
jgi:hypothetical protein